MAWPADALAMLQPLSAEEEREHLMQVRWRDRDRETGAQTAESGSLRCVGGRSACTGRAVNQNNGAVRGVAAMQ